MAEVRPTSLVRLFVWRSAEKVFYMARFQMQNLPWDVHKTGLEAVFRYYGIIVSDIEIIRDHCQGAGRPVAIVTIDEAETGKRVMYRLIGTAYIGRDIDLREVP
jgi:hypothetical protein